VSPRSGLLVSLGAALALLALLAGPLLLHPGSRVIRGDNDTRLNVWTVAWGCERLLRDPLRLYDPNIYFPETGAYAYMDNFLAHSLIGLPAYALGGARAYRAYNIALIASALLMAICGYLLFLELSGSAPAATFASLMFLFGLPHLSRITQINLFALPFLLLALFLIHRLCRAPRAALGLALGLSFALQATSGAYPTVYLALLLLTAGPLVAWHHRSLRRPAWWGAVLIALLLALALVGPLLLPYLENARERGLTRSLSGIERLSPNWPSYVVAHSSFYLALWRAAAPELLRRADTALFVGLVPLALALIGLLRAGRGFQRAAALYYGAAGLVALWGSTGSAGGLYPLLYQWIPIFRLTRAPARLILVVFLSLCALSAIGLAGLEARAARWRWVWRPALAALFLIEIWRPLPIVALPDRAGPAIERLARQPGPAVLAEFPFDSKLQRRYMVLSTYHWMNLIGGNTTFSSPRYQRRARALAAFPAPEALETLAEFHPLWILVHLDHYPPERRAALRRRLAALDPIEPAGAWGGDLLFRWRGEQVRRGRTLSLVTPLPRPWRLTFEARSARPAALHLSLNGSKLMRHELEPAWRRYRVELAQADWRRHANRLRWRSEAGPLELRAVRFDADPATADSPAPRAGGAPRDRASPRAALPARWPRPAAAAPPPAGPGRALAPGPAQSDSSVRRDPDPG